MHDLFDSFTIDKKNSRVIEHFGKDFNVLLFEGFASIREFQFTAGIFFVGNFGKNSIWKFIFPSQNHFRS